MKKNNIVTIMALMMCFAAVAFGQEKIPRVLYVTAKEGLVAREEPSTSSKRLGAVPYGYRLTPFERSEKVTVNDITDYWYRANFNGFDYGWLFGGYLSKDYPKDAPVLSGRWDVENDDRQYYSFVADHTYWEGYKETDMGVHGRWSLDGNTITIVLTGAGNEAFEEEDYDTCFVQLAVTNRDAITLTFPNGKVRKLRRNNTD